VSQLFALTTLAPDIRAEILEMESVDGIEPAFERTFRALTRISGWTAQRRAFGAE
jgi:hypothetical protein